ncbi:MAG TPA: hypothetical protein VJT72_19670 [Pseudonocardiaceae bacterium]|nr:hypothetical protein [Pseudonocardiaceae bacterium]
MENFLPRFVAAATNGHTQPELADHLDGLGVTTDWAALVAALRRVLAGDRDSEQLLAGLARATLTHLAATHPEFAAVIDHAVRLAEDTTRFEPATLALGSLVLLVLQTEIKVDRDITGQWQFRLHKKAIRDATLGRLLGKLLALYTNTPQK